MKFARDSNNQLVSAVGAAGSRQIYRCPSCNARVRLKRGIIQLPHFAHLRGLGRPECELYHPSHELVGPNPTAVMPSAAPPRVIEPIKLVMEVEPHDINTRYPRRWRLKILVPKTDSSHGQLQLRCGPIYQPKISFAQLVIGSRVFDADANESEYRVTWFSPDVPKDYRESWQHPIAGLQQEKVNVFSARSQRLKPVASILRWGLAYYFIWHHDDSIDLPAELDVLKLQANSNWQAALVSLPADATREVENWLRKYCDMPIAPQSDRWGIAYPVPYEIDEDGKIVVTPSDAVYFTMDKQGAATKDYDGAASQGSEKDQFEKKCVEIFKGESSTLPIFWQQEPVVEIVFKPLPKADLNLGITVTYAEGGGSAENTVKLHDPECEKVFQVVRSGSGTIIGIEGPIGFNGNLRWVHPVKGMGNKNLVLSEVCDRYSKLTNDDLDLLNLFLRERTVTLDVSFGALGYCRADSAKYVNSLMLHPHARVQALWLCKLSNIYATDDGTFLERANDDEVLALLKSVNLPAPFRAHAYAINKMFASRGDAA